MCDYSLHHVKTRPAGVGDKLTTSDFGTGTHGFAASEDASVAVCLLPGTELSFAEEVRFWPNWSTWHRRIVRVEADRFGLSDGEPLREWLPCHDAIGIKAAAGYATVVRD